MFGADVLQLPIASIFPYSLSPDRSLHDGHATAIGTKNRPRLNIFEMRLWSCEPAWQFLNRQQSSYVLATFESVHDDHGCMTWLGKLSVLRGLSAVTTPHQSWALSVFFNFSIIKFIFLHLLFFIKLLTYFWTSPILKKPTPSQINLIKNAKNHNIFEKINACYTQSLFQTPQR